jgi:glutathione S-transferase
MKRFTLYGSPHSLPTYKVALMLHMSGAPFSFRYVSFQKGMHKTPEFQALSRWAQVPVLLDNGRTHLQATAIVEHLAETLGRFQGHDADVRQRVREWLYWEVDTLFPPIFNDYGVFLGKNNLLPISVEPAIADYHRRRAELALATLDSHIASAGYICCSEPTIADLVCCADLAFAGLSGIDVERWKNVSDWSARVQALPRFAAPFDLLSMADAEIS